MIPYQIVVIGMFEKNYFLNFENVLAMKQNSHGRKFLVCFKYCLQSTNTFIIDLGLIVYPHHKHGSKISEQKDLLKKMCMKTGHKGKS